VVSTDDIAGVNPHYETKSSDGGRNGGTDRKHHGGRGQGPS
jgi:hypothetical protein